MKHEYLYTHIHTRQISLSARSRLATQRSMQGPHNMPRGKFRRTTFPSRSPWMSNIRKCTWASETETKYLPSQQTFGRNNTVSVALPQLAKTLCYLTYFYLRAVSGIFKLSLFRNIIYFILFVGLCLCYHMYHV